MQDIDIVLLAKKINTHYSLSQIKQLCFELGIEYDDLDGNGKIDKARELALEMRRQIRLPELVGKVLIDRPNVASSLHNESLLPQTLALYNRLVPYRWLILITLISTTMLIFAIFKIVIGDGNEINSRTYELNMTPLVDSPCPKIYFLSESSELTLQNRQILDDCALSSDIKNPESVLHIRGSSAWPSKYPPLTKADILKIAEERALLAAYYLKSQGVDPKLIIVETILPVEDRWDTNDPKILEQDRFVEFSLESIPKTGR